MVMSAGAIPIFIRLLTSAHQELVDQSMWALGNLAGDSPLARNYILSSGVVSYLAPLADRWTENLSGVQTYAWVLTNLCCGQPLPDPIHVEHVIPVLAYLLKTYRDETMVKDVCLSLIAVVDQGYAMIDAVLDTGLAPVLVSLLLDSSLVKVQAGLHVVGDILAGSEAHTQQMIDAGVIAALATLATPEDGPRPQHSMQREALWALSNITAGTTAQVNAVFETALLHLPQIIQTIVHSPDFTLRKEALMVFAQAIPSVAWHHIQHWLDTLQFVRVLCDSLHVDETAVIIAALETMHQLLIRAQQEGHLDSVVDALDEHCSLDTLQNLQMHANAEVYELSARVIEDLFLEVGEEEGDDENSGDE